MRSITLTCFVVGLVLLLGACGGESAEEAVSSPPPVASSSTSTTAAAQVTSTVANIAAPDVGEDGSTRHSPAEPETAESFPDGAGLGEKGPFGVGVHQFETDPSRGDRVSPYSVWYPAKTSSQDRGETDAPPDRSGAPYPVVVGSMRGASMWAPHFATHGYVFVGSPEAPDTGGWDTWILDYALDELYALDWLETTEDEPLVGMADTAQTGVVDYSFGAIPALVLAGARISPDDYLAACAAPTDLPPGIQENNCLAAEDWDSFETYGAALGIATDGGLWRSMTDNRIKAVIPGAPEGGWLFGDDGLAAATVPVLLMTGSADDLNGYEFETAYIYEHLGSPTDLVTFVGADHFMILSSDARQQVQRFATAFFGLHLKGDDRYAQYLTAEFVEVEAPTIGKPPEVYETLKWGLVQD